MLASDVQAVGDEQLRTVYVDGPLGVMVTRAASRNLLEGLLGQAAELGIGIHVFFTDEAVSLLSDPEWVDRLPEGSYAACEVSAQRLDVHPPSRVVMGGQYQNAIMVRDAARVVTL